MQHYEKRMYTGAVSPRMSETVPAVPSDDIVTREKGELGTDLRSTQRPKEVSSIEEKLQALERRGIVVRSGKPWKPIEPVATKPGALKRFLAERG